MKDLEGMKTGLTEGIFRVIDRETEGALDYETHVWQQAEALVNLITSTLFDEGTEHDDIEELYADMDQFTGN